MTQLFTVHFNGSCFHMLHDDEDMYQFKILHVEGRRLINMACCRHVVHLDELTPLEKRAYDHLEESFYQHVHQQWQQCQEGVE